MMTIGSIATSNGYYENNPEGNYYLDDQLQSQFIGEGAKDLGIYGEPVIRETQDYLMKGILPTGETTKRFNSKHRSGYDFTFSAPKSVSVLSLVTGDTRLIEAHKKAVEDTIGEIEKLASVRTKENNVYSITHTNNLVVALHTHDTSRELDPQLHTHALVFNITKNNEGDWQSLSSDKLNKTGFIEGVFANQLAFGNIYRQVLKNQVEAMGFKTIETGKNGLWEIAGVPTAEFSTRRNQIVSLVGEDATAKERDKATLDTRKIKVSSDKNELHKSWNELLSKTGFNKEDFYKKLEEKPLNLTVNDNKELNQLAVNKAIELLSDNKGQISYQEILNASLSLSAHNVGVINEIKKSIGVAIEKNLITPIDKELGVFVSKVNLEREQNINKLSGDIKPTNINMTNNRYYSDDKGINSFFKHEDKIAVLTGDGNTLTQVDRLNELNRVANKNGLTSLVVVQSQKMKKEFNNYNVNNLITINELDKANLTSNTLLIVPDAEILTLKQTENILLTSKNSQSSIAMIDTKTKIGAGNSLDVLRKNQIAEYDFTTFNKPEINIKIQSIASHHERYDRLVKDYVSEQIKTNNAIIIASNDKEKVALTNSVREELKNNNKLGKDDISISVHKPKYLSGHDRFNIENYKKGMVLEHWHNKTLSRYDIISVDKQRNLLYLQNGKKQEVMPVRKISSEWSLIEQKDINISEKDKLISIGSLSKGSIKANEELTVVKIKKTGFVVSDESGKNHSLSFKNAHKLDYNYVKSAQNTLNHDKVIFTSLTNRNLNKNTLNQLIKTGENINIYSPLDYDKTTKKLSELKNIKLISERLKGDEYSSIDEAIKGRKDQAFSDVQKAVNIGIGVSQGSNVFFSVNKVVSESLKANSQLTLNQVTLEIDSRIKNGEIHFIKSANGVGQYIGVSNEIYQQEKNIQSIIAKGIGSEKPLLNNQQMKNVDMAHLTKGQQNATKNILTSSDQFLGIQGLAGVGKTTQLKTVLEQLKNHKPDIEIIGLAPTHKAVYELQSVGVKAQTISSFLVDIKNDSANNPNFNLKNKLFLIDESSMIGNKNTLSLYETIALNGGRGIYSGDSKQLLSIDSGAAFSLQQNYTQLKFSVMNDIVRQNKDLKPAIYSLLNSQAQKALTIIDSISPDVVKRDVQFNNLNNVVDEKVIKDNGYDSVIEYIAKDYSSRNKSSRDNTIIVTQLNDDKSLINQQIHNELYSSNKLGNKEVAINILTPILVNEHDLNKTSTYELNLNNILAMNKEYYKIEKINNEDNIVLLKNVKSEVTTSLDPNRISEYSDLSLYKQEQITVSENDKVLINRTNQDKGFVANSEWVIKNIDNSKLELLDNSGNQKTIDLNNVDERHFSLGYARTDYSSQGASSNFAIVYEKSDKSLANMRSSYVAISRAKEHVSFITDDVSKWVKNVGKIEDRLSATELLGENKVSNPIPINIDDIIRNEIQHIDPNINIDEVKNKLSSNDMATLPADELKGRVEEVINQFNTSQLKENSSDGERLEHSQIEKQSINDEKNEIAKDFADSIKKELMIDTLRQNEQNIIIDDKEMKIDEKTL